jgi:oxygen-independent coproporphyrinogen-3 oxidase
MKQLVLGQLPLEIETLTLANRINEYIMTGLRTIWGCNWAEINIRFGNQCTTILKQKIEPYINNQKILDNGENFKLTPQARILADGIASDLFFD